MKEKINLGEKTKEEIFSDLNFYFFMYVLISIILILLFLVKDYLWSLLFSFFLGFIFYCLIWELIYLNELTRESE